MSSMVATRILVGSSNLSYSSTAEILFAVVMQSCVLHNFLIDKTYPTMENIFMDEREKAVVTIHENTGKSKKDPERFDNSRGKFINLKNSYFFCLMASQPA